MDDTSRARAVGELRVTEIEQALRTGDRPALETLLSGAIPDEDLLAGARVGCASLDRALDRLSDYRARRPSRARGHVHISIVVDSVLVGETGGMSVESGRR